MRRAIVSLTIAIALMAAWPNDSHACTLPNQGDNVITVGGSQRTDASEPYSRASAQLERRLCDCNGTYVLNDNPFWGVGDQGLVGNQTTLDNLSNAISANANNGGTQHISAFSQGAADVNYLSQPGSPAFGIQKWLVNPAISANSPIQDASNTTVMANIDDIVWTQPGNLHTVQDYIDAGANVQFYRAGNFHDYQGGLSDAYSDPQAGPCAPGTPPNTCTSCGKKPCGLCAPTGPKPLPGNPGVGGPVLAPIDPNEKVGPTGVGSTNQVPAGQAMPYQIAFENMPTANATVQEVNVTDFLNSKLDWSTIHFKDINYGGRKIVIPSGVSSFSTIDIPPNDGCVILGTGSLGVNISLEFNSQTGLIALDMKVIDTTTATFPADPGAGILPPRSACRGGYLEYAVNPLSSDPVGTLVTNQASIVFDSNPAIVTNQVSNAIGDPFESPDTRATGGGKTGCGCSSDGETAPIWAVAVLAVDAFARRRRALVTKLRRRS